MIREATFMDIISVFYSMNEDHAKDWHAMLPGTTLDAYAISKWQVPGLKFVHCTPDGRPTCVGGFDESNPGVMSAWFVQTDESKEHAMELVRFMRKRALPTVMQIRHRVQALCREENGRGNALLLRLGFLREGVLHRLGSDGANYVQYGMTRPL